MTCDCAAVRRVEHIRMDGDIAVMIAVSTVRIDMRIVEIDFTAGNGVVPAVRIDRAREVDAARSARNRLLDVHAERHVDHAALIETSGASAVADVDDLILPELAVVAVKILVEQRELRRIVYIAAELDIPIGRHRQDVERLRALHLAAQVDRIGLERERTRPRIDGASRSGRQILRLEGKVIAVRPNIRRAVERHRACRSTGADRRRIDEVQRAADIRRARRVFAPEVDVLKAILDLRAAEEVFGQCQPRTRHTDVEVRRGIRLLYGEIALALDALGEGHDIGGKLNVARRTARLARLHTLDGTRSNGRTCGRCNLADIQCVRLDLDGERVGGKRADFVVLFKRDVAAENSKVRRRNLTRRLVRRCLGIDNERRVPRERHISCEVDVIRLECHVLPERRICNIDRALRAVADGVMREVRAEYLRELIVRQLKVARRTVTKPDGFRAVVRSDAERACARDGRTAAARGEVRDAVRIEIQRTSRTNIHFAAGRVLDSSRR